MEQKNEYDDYLLPFKYDQYMEARKWVNDIPFIQFPADWEVKIIPPFGGATVRFLVKMGDARVSIYLDCYDRLGCCGQPYWEVYPNEDDTYRCWMHETDMLLKAIQEGIDFQLNKKDNGI